MNLYLPRYRDKSTGEIKTSSVWWLRCSIRGRKTRLSLEVRDKSAAMVRAGEVVRQLELGDTPSTLFSRRESLPTLLDRFRREMVDHRLSTKHISVTLSRLEKVLSTHSLPSLSSTNLITSLSQLTTSSRTLGAYYSALSRFFSFLRHKGLWVGESPLARVDLRSLGSNSKRRARAPRRALDPEEQARLLCLSPADRRGVYLLALTTGLRRGELARLAWPWVDLAGGVLRLPAEATKNRREAVLPLHLKAAEVLRERTKSGFLVFPQIPSLKTFRRDLAKAGIEGTTGEGLVDFHSLRVTFCTNLARTNTHLPLTQNLMRHSDPKITSSIYTKYSIEERRKAVEGSLPALTYMKVPDGLSNSTTQIQYNTNGPPRSEVGAPPDPVAPAPYLFGPASA